MEQVQLVMLAVPAVGPQMEIDEMPFLHSISPCAAANAFVVKDERAWMKHYLLAVVRGALTDQKFVEVVVIFDESAQTFERFPFHHHRRGRDPINLEGSA